MVDRLVISTRLNRLEEYLKILKGLQKYPLDRFKRDPLIRGSAEHYLHLAIECCLDMGNHVIADRGFRKPEDYKEIFLILGEEKFLPSKFAKSLVPMVRFRNLVIHDYLRVDPAQVFQILQNHLADLRKLARAFGRLL